MRPRRDVQLTIWMIPVCAVALALYALWSWLAG